jgi:tetratricopeptide (TPR) repeat protein
MSKEPAKYNRFAGTIAGSLIQAGSISGDIHVHEHEQLTAVPRQLPCAVPNFVGRRREVETLMATIDQSSQDRTVVISAIGGIAGVGKTALAVHWAHRVAKNFPDGQIYVNLHGFDPDRRPVMPSDALVELLHTLGVPPEHIPPGVEAQTALYRSRLSGQQVLIVLDNALNADQVRPLLPGDRPAMVVVTSRNQLAGLVVHEGARCITLDVLTRQEAVTLLAGRIGQSRVQAEPGAASEMIERCGQLPLALSIVAARAAARPDFPLDGLAQELRDGQARLDALNVGDESMTNIRSVFSSSYHALTPGAAKIFGLLGISFGSDISLEGAASLIGMSVVKTHTLLAELTHASLLEEHLHHRYRLHDLLRIYAKEQADVCHSPPGLHSAKHRLLDYYLHTGMAAALRLYPNREVIATRKPHSDITLTQIGDYATAIVWFTAEKRNLLAAIQESIDDRFDDHGWQLPWTMATFLNRQGYWHDWVAVHKIALVAAQRLGDRTAQARTHRTLGSAYMRLGQIENAMTHLEHALAVYRENGDHSGQARTHLTFGVVYEATGEYSHGIEHARRALDFYRATGRRFGEARACNIIGRYYTYLGDYLQAIENCQHALEIFQEINDHTGQGNAFDNLGNANYCSNRFAEAVEMYLPALMIWRNLGDQFEEATTLACIGDSHEGLGHTQLARDHWQQAMALFDELKRPDAEEVRRRIARLGKE